MSDKQELTMEQAQRERRVARAVRFMAKVEWLEKRARAFVKTELGELTAADRKYADDIDTVAAERLWDLIGKRSRVKFS